MMWITVIVLTLTSVDCSGSDIDLKSEIEFEEEEDRLRSDVRRPTDFQSEFYSFGQMENKNYISSLNNFFCAKRLV